MAASNGVIILLYLLLVDYTLADISNQNPPNGACLCLDSNSVNVRDAACGNVIGSSNNGMCYAYKGQKVGCTLSGTFYQFFEVNFGGRSGWISGNYMIVGSDSQCGSVISFSGYDWEVRSGTGGPGPNDWSADNVFVDADGLHLKISNSGSTWSCAEVTLTQRLGFGVYEFQLTGRPDLFDRNVVLGLFNYPPADVGPDGTNEIDIEFAQWGQAGNRNRLNWTVYPPALGPGTTHNEFPLELTGTATTHRFDWTSTGVDYHSFHGYSDVYLIAEWNNAPPDPINQIPQQPIPVHMNLWLFQGQAPVDGQPVEVVIRSFIFTPH